MFSHSNRRQKTGNRGQKKRKSDFCLPSSIFCRLSSRGFTLIEVLIAISILAIGLVLVVQSMGSTQLALRLSENVIRASYIAEEQMVKMELKVRELERLAFGGQSGKVEFPGRIMQWESGAEHFDDRSIKNNSRVNKLYVKVDWKETLRQETFQIQTLILDKKNDANL